MRKKGKEKEFGQENKGGAQTVSKPDKNIIQTNISRNSIEFKLKIKYRIKLKVHYNKLHKIKNTSKRTIREA